MIRRTRGRCFLSIVVVKYGMQREIPRTVRSLCAPYQVGIDALDYEVLVVDNGESEDGELAALAALSPRVRVLRRSPAGGPSPAPAVNWAVGQSRGDYVAVLLDGARMSTPGVLRSAWQALSISDDVFVTTMGWHIGPSHQSLSMQAGYSAAVEDDLLEKIGWPAEGYRLFEISALAWSNPGGWFGPQSESPFVFLGRQLFELLGGYDERFTSPGGGLVNLELFERAISLRGVAHVSLLGEGLFHQVHGGVATNADDPHETGIRFAAEYEALIGRGHVWPAISPTYFGILGPQARIFLRPPAS